jgi:hypothetical protein
MRIVNERLETITEYDLNKGILTQGIAIKEDATPIDNIIKFAWYDDDYEEVMIYIPKVEETSMPTQLDIIEAQVTYTAMMTDTLLEV